MTEKPRGHPFNIFPQLSLRKRFALGLGLMLMPVFMLAGSSFIIFEQVLSSFEQAENQTLEKRFPLAELKKHLGKARPTISALLSKPNQPERKDHLNDLNRVITYAIEDILQNQSISPEKHGLLVSVDISWKRVYHDSMAYPKNLTLNGLSQAEAAQVRSQFREKLYQELEEAQQGIDRVEILLARFQTADNLERARQLKQRERLWIGCITLVAISIALLSAILLSRSVLRSMQILIDALEALSEGKLENRIEWNHPDEFGRLANAINDMAQKLAQSQQALIESATLDGLTGIFNRREFNRLLTVEIERSRRNNNPVSMVMVDIDHFKSINDTYGHQSGDDALRWVSSILQREVRPGDIVARYGGEEFAIILPNTQSEDAGIVAERIRHKMESELVPIQKGLTISVTASLGCATYPYVGDSEDLLMSAADKALYRAKETGRNQVCQAQPELDVSELNKLAKKSVVNESTSSVSNV